MFKLENGLVTYDQLDDDQNLVVLLLEWFNADKPQMELDVLRLLKSLIQVSALAIFHTSQMFLIS